MGVTSNKKEDDETSSSSGAHLHTFSSPAPSPVKRRPPAASSMVLTSFLEKSLPISSNLKDQDQTIFETSSKGAVEQTYAVAVVEGAEQNWRLSNTSMPALPSSTSRGKVHSTDNKSSSNNNKITSLHLEPGKINTNTIHTQRGISMGFKPVEDRKKCSSEISTSNQTQLGIQSSYKTAQTPAARRVPRKLSSGGPSPEILLGGGGGGGGGGVGGRGREKLGEASDGALRFVRVGRHCRVRRCVWTVVERLRTSGAELEKTPELTKQFGVAAARGRSISDKLLRSSAEERADGRKKTKTRMCILSEHTKVPLPSSFSHRHHQIRVGTALPPRLLQSACGVASVAAGSGQGRATVPLTSFNAWRRVGHYRSPQTAPEGVEGGRERIEGGK
uniref:Uncharacterized protein n=1 Tax=Oryza nivara TaxID=4536 RepID=A0A0E0FHC7_ORYNI